MRPLLSCTYKTLSLCPFFSIGCPHPHKTPTLLTFKFAPSFYTQHPPRAPLNSFFLLPPLPSIYFSLSSIPYSLPFILSPSRPCFKEPSVSAQSAAGQIRRTEDRMIIVFSHSWDPLGKVQLKRLEEVTSVLLWCVPMWLRTHTYSICDVAVHVRAGG